MAEGAEVAGAARGLGHFTLAVPDASAAVALLKSSGYGSLVLDECSAVIPVRAHGQSHTVGRQAVGHMVALCAAKRTKQLDTTGGTPVRPQERASPCPPCCNEGRLAATVGPTITGTPAVPACLRRARSCRHRRTARLECATSMATRGS